MDKHLKTEIEREFELCVNRTIQRLDSEDTHRPFHAALLSEDALFWSRFERSFSTSFGQGAIQRLSQAAAVAGGATESAIVQSTRVRLARNKIAAIDDHIRQLTGGNSGAQVGWDVDVAEIRAISGSDESSEIRIISDLWFVRGGVEHFLSIKTVKPNIDQTAVAKRDLMLLSTAKPDSQVYFGLYYNPYGAKRSDYAWTPPMRIFDFHNDSVVLIGKDYWDKLGGAGTYEEMLVIAGEVGAKTRASLAKLRETRVRG